VSIHLWGFLLSLKLPTLQAKSCGRNMWMKRRPTDIEARWIIWKGELSLGVWRYSKWVMRRRERQGPRDLYRNVPKGCCSKKTSLTFLSAFTSVYISYQYYEKLSTCPRFSSSAVSRFPRVSDDLPATQPNAHYKKEIIWSYFTLKIEAASFSETSVSYISTLITTKTNTTGLSSSWTLSCSIP
jgi:hypothetical protein